MQLILIVFLNRNNVPPRPVGQRSEPEANVGFPGIGFGDGSFHMSFGIGAFPFGFFTSTFNIGEGSRPSAGMLLFVLQASIYILLFLVENNINNLL